MAGCGNPPAGQPPLTVCSTPPPIPGLGPSPTPTPTPISPTPSPTPTPTPTPNPGASPYLWENPPTPTPGPSPTPHIVWFEEDFLITHYPFALESDPAYANDERVAAIGLPPENLYREGFLFGPRGILDKGTGLAEDGKYITIDWWAGGPQGKNTPFKYGIGGQYSSPVAWETVAAGDPRLPSGTRIVIEVYPSRVFTVTDTGGGVGANHIDIFVGAITLAEADELGAKSSRVGIVL